MSKGPRQPGPGREPRDADSHLEEQLGDAGSRRVVAHLWSRQARRGHDARAGRSRRGDQDGEDDAAAGRDLSPERLPTPLAASARGRERALRSQHRQGASAPAAHLPDPRRPHHLMARGLFITFEGPEGSGKTTQVELLGSALASREPVLVREPGGNELGERIREIVLYGSMELDAEAEMYLFMAARRQLIAEVIAPALAAGQIVVADRYHDSTLAYQGGAQGEPSTCPATFPRPDITFLLSVPVQSGLERLAKAGNKPDLVASESIALHKHLPPT